jgi:TatD DNase family protein
MFIDTHCHLDFPEFDRDRDQVIRRAQAEDISYIINIGSSLKGSKDSVSLAKKYDAIYATVGLHPHEADKFDKKSEDLLKILAREDKVVAIGEIGLDYFKNYSKPTNQMPQFLSLLELAKDSNLPVVIHSRQAEDDILKVLKSLMPLKAVVHCFSGSENFMKSCLDLGFFISFTCNITYKKADNLRRLVKIVPLDKLMLETDAPYLSPEGFRGNRNEPMHVKLLAKEIAAIKGFAVEDVAKATSQNAKVFFGLK